MTIVCGTDLSKSAGSAAHVAARLSRARSETLALLHVVEDLGAEIALNEGGALYAAERDRLRDAADLARELGGPVETKLLAGDPARVLATHAAAERATLLVVASSRDEEPRPWNLGSIAERLARTSTTPVLVVRDPTAFDAWLSGQRPLRIVLGVERTEASRGALRWLRALNDIAPLELRVVHVARSAKEAADVGRDGAPALADAVARDLRDDLSASGIVDADVVVVDTAHDGAADAQLVSAATSFRADLLVLATHQRSAVERWWHGSLSRGALRLASTNVLLVPSGVANEEPRPVPVIRNVLFATDFSDGASRVLVHAASLIPDGGTIHMVHVIRSARGGTPITAFLPTRPRDVDDATLAEVRDRLEALVPREIAVTGARTETHVIIGSDVATELCSLADRLAVDVVCMGCRGRSGAVAAVLGSTAQQVLAHASRPVLVVRTTEG